MAPLGAVSHRYNFFLNLQERDLYERLSVDGRTILEWILKKLVSIRGTVFDSAQNRDNGESLGMRYCTSGFHKPWNYILFPDTEAK